VIKGPRARGIDRAADEPPCRPHSIDWTQSHPLRERPNESLPRPPLPLSRQAHCRDFARCCQKIPIFCRAVNTQRGLMLQPAGGSWGD